ncbi:hypothetical protein E2542_SST30583 [Spatholobus suberectus]|nr:hypothetical protein E2542_SST30583 [Spatholobus suberectus]
MFYGELSTAQVLGRRGGFVAGIEALQRYAPVATRSALARPDLPLPQLDLPLLRPNLPPRDCDRASSSSKMTMVVLVTP